MAAVDPGSVATGVTQSQQYETLVADIHGLGEHDPRTPSTRRPPLSAYIRAGDDPANYDSQGRPLTMPPVESTGYDPRLVGGVDETLAALDEMADDRDEHASIESLMQREVRITGHSSGNGRRRTKPVKPTSIVDRVRDDVMEGSIGA